MPVTSKEILVKIGEVGMNFPAEKEMHTPTVHVYSQLLPVDFKTIFQPSKNTIKLNCNISQACFF